MRDSLIPHFFDWTLFQRMVQLNMFNWTILWNNYIVYNYIVYITSNTITLKHYFKEWFNLGRGRSCVLLSWSVHVHLYNTHSWDSIYILLMVPSRNGPTSLGPFGWTTGSICGPGGLFALCSSWLYASQCKPVVIFWCHLLFMAYACICEHDLSI